MWGYTYHRESRSRFVLYGCWTFKKSALLRYNGQTRHGTYTKCSLWSSHLREHPWNHMVIEGTHTFFSLLHAPPRPSCLPHAPQSHTPFMLRAFAFPTLLCKWNHTTAPPVWSGFFHSLSLQASPRLWCKSVEVSLLEVCRVFVVHSF